MQESEPTFRDRPLNINERGGRKWIYAMKPSGKWYKWRTMFSWLVLIFLIGVPFIRIGDHPLILLDIAGRKFILFGVIFWAQDTFILALLMLSFIVFIALFTVTFGRLWCGWACPQTVFLEMVFRKIEYLIEGDARKRKKRDNGPWTKEKILKKALKHGIFIILSVSMINVFWMWFIGSDKWLHNISDSFSEHVSEFTVVLLISAVFYWIYSFFREQICTMVCPYGRMQGVLLDSYSIVVSYDYLRGEPRGAKSSGDCIDCYQCVAVCPTGIDIRNGTQLECINCTSCIDQCNKIMKATGKTPGLIRYASEKGIKEGHSTLWNARNRAYSAVLLILISFFIFMLISRPNIETTVLRIPGLLYQEAAQNRISNLYNIKIVNKTHKEIPLEIKLMSHNGEIILAGNSMLVKDQDKFESSFILLIPRDELSGDKTRIEFGIYSAGELLETCSATFIGP